MTMLLVLLTPIRSLRCVTEAPTKTLEATESLVGAWKAIAGNGETGDPDGEGDERELRIDRNGTLSWTNGGGGGPYCIGNASLPFRVLSPDGEVISFSRGDPVSDLPVIVADFQYATPATIWYRRRPGGPETGVVD